MLDLDWRTIAYQIINFAALLVILYYSRSATTPRSTSAAVTAEALQSARDRGAPQSPARGSNAWRSSIAHEEILAAAARDASTARPRRCAGARVLDGHRKDATISSACATV